MHVTCSHKAVSLQYPAQQVPPCIAVTAMQPGGVDPEPCSAEGGGGAAGMSTGPAANSAGHRHCSLGTLVCMQWQAPQPLRHPVCEVASWLMVLPWPTTTRVHYVGPW
jgi:hypothetical protein